MLDERLDIAVLSADSLLVERRPRPGGSSVDKRLACTDSPAGLQQFDREIEIFRQRIAVVATDVIDRGAPKAAETPRDDVDKSHCRKRSSERVNPNRVFENL